MYSLFSPTLFMKSVLYSSFISFLLLLYIHLLQSDPKPRQPQPIILLLSFSSSATLLTQSSPSTPSGTTLADKELTKNNNLQFKKALFPEHKLSMASVDIEICQFKDNKQTKVFPYMTFQDNHEDMLFLPFIFKESIQHFENSTDNNNVDLFQI